METETITCSNCENKVPSGAFCRDCGAPLSSTAESTSPTGETAASQQPDTGAVEAKGKRAARWIAWRVIALLVVVGIPMLATANIRWPWSPIRARIIFHVPTAEPMDFRGCVENPPIYDLRHGAEVSIYDDAGSWLAREQLKYSIGDYRVSGGFEDSCPVILDVEVPRHHNYKIVAGRVSVEVDRATLLERPPRVAKVEVAG